MKDQHLLTLRDLAQYFRQHDLSMKWLHHEAEAGRIPSLKTDRRLLFNPDAVEAALIELAKVETPDLAKGGTVTNPLATTLTPTIEKLLTYKHAGDLLGVTERTVWTLVAEGELPAVRFGRSVRVDPADLRAYIDRCKTTSKGVQQ